MHVNLGTGRLLFARAHVITSFHAIPALREEKALIAGLVFAAK